jgi:Mce-associated membrane protein
VSAVRRTAPLVLAALLLAVGIVGWWMSITLRHSGASDNAAVVDSKTTAQVQASVTQTLGRVLTYDYQDPRTTEVAADELLAGAARSEYATLFASLQKRAPGQKLQLTAEVQAIGVTQLRGSKAELLVFLDQSSRRAKDDQASVSAAQLTVTAQKMGDRWKITGLKPL